MRLKTGATAALSSTTQSASQTPDTQEANMSQQPTFDPTEDAETAPLSPPPTNNTSTAHQSIAVTSTTNPKRRQPRRPRAPSPSTLARASLSDSIFTLLPPHSRPHRYSLSHTDSLLWQLVHCIFDEVAGTADRHLLVYLSQFVCLKEFKNRVTCKTPPVSSCTAHTRISSYFNSFSRRNHVRT